jgi:hypothetical protein
MWALMLWYMIMIRDSVFYNTPQYYRQTCYVIRHAQQGIQIGVRNKNINLLKPNGYICTTDFNILILCITLTKCICKFHMILIINSYCFPK